jgi:predicted AlkP superfamily phosphohydrolase/phosphomutase
MGNRVNRFRTITAVLIVLAAISAVYVLSSGPPATERRLEGKKTVKLYWFIPDGFRADPHTFKVYEWAEQGLLPNIKRMMEQGSYGYSVPVFPGHTPTNFATLLTGSTPKVHGVADGPMRVHGYPLEMVSKSGFSTVAKKVPPIWVTLEQMGQRVTLLSVPGSTPPELSRGITIRGRWGGWGLDFPAINFHTSSDTNLRVLQGHGNKVFEFGSELTKFLEAGDPSSWQLPVPASFSPPREIQLSNWGAVVYGYVYDSTDDGIDNYNGVLLSLDKKKQWTQLQVGQWSDWLPIKLRYQTQNDYNIYTPKKMDWERNLSTVTLDTEVKIKVIKLGKKDFFRIRFFYNNMNIYSAKPAHVAEQLTRMVGPMVDFADNFPPQLIYFHEDKGTFLEEAHMSMEWHKRAAAYLMENVNTDVIIHDIYTPNQMLTSRWWLGHIDPQSPRFNQSDDELRERLWNEVKAMYVGIDAIIGEILDRAGPDTYVVLSSDHGAVPLHKEVRLNNLLASEGLLEYSYDSRTGEYEIDWEQTKAVFLKMDNIYLNPNGLAGRFQRASGPEYERLRDRVISIMDDLRDEDGAKPLARVTKWEDAEYIGLPKDRVGDLIIANKAGYGWVEELTENGEVFTASLPSGYKQAVIPDNEQGMWTPFMIMGPGVRHNHALDKPIRHVDQYPTIMTLIGAAIPEFVEGEAISEVYH